MTDRTFHFIISSLNCEFEGRIARGKRNEIFYSEEAALYNKNIVLETLLLNDDTKITAANKNLEEQLYKSDIYAGSRYEKEYLLFQLGCKKYRIITIFTSDLSKLPLSLIQESLQLVDFKCNYPKKGINSYDSLSKDGRIYAATIINKNILSICGMSHLGYGYCVDIGVETSNFYRNRGFATSNVVYMAKHLLENNTDFTYTCSKKKQPFSVCGSKGKYEAYSSKNYIFKRLITK